MQQETLQSLENQLTMCNQYLSGDIQEWEREEYSEVKKELIKEIEELKKAENVA